MNQDTPFILNCHTRAIQKQSSIVNEEPLINCQLSFQDQQNLFKQEAILYAHDDTPYAEGKFLLDIVYPTNYPLKPPIIKFRTKIYHPNIDEDGSIWMDILYTEWSPAMTITQVILNIHSILFEPLDKDEVMLVPHVKEVYLNNKQLYTEIAAAWTQNYAFD